MLPNTLLATRGGAPLVSGTNARNVSQRINAERALPLHNVRCWLDIPYIDDGHDYHKLDIYAPIEPDSQSLPRPPPRRVIVFVHGGGWKRFHRRHSPGGMHGNVGRSFASRGFVVAVISYRKSRVLLQDQLLLWSCLSALCGGVTVAFLSLRAVGSVIAAFVVPFGVCMAYYATTYGCLGRKGVQHPGHAQDAAAAIVWVTRNIGAYMGDASDITIMGHSAGGHICSMLLVDPTLLHAVGVEPSCIRSAVLMSGVYSARKLGLLNIVWPGQEEAAEAQLLAKLQGAGMLVESPSSSTAAKTLVRYGTSNGGGGGDAPMPSVSSSSVAKQSGGTTVAASSASTAAASDHPLLLHAHEAGGAVAVAVPSATLGSATGAIVDPPAPPQAASPSSSDLSVRARWYSPLCWPSALFRTLWFLRPAFGTDLRAWDAQFPVGRCWDAAKLRALQLPPILLINAQFDVGLEQHTALWQAQLMAAGLLCQAAVHDEEEGRFSSSRNQQPAPVNEDESSERSLRGAIVVERYTVRRANHVSYVLGMGRRGYDGEELVAPAIVGFLRVTGRV